MTENEIRSQINEARRAYEVAKSSKARREAAEDIEFWTNKAAALTIATRNGWAF